MNTRNAFGRCTIMVCALSLIPDGAFAASGDALRTTLVFEDATLFAPQIASTTQYSEVRLTISPDGSTALWFSRNRPGGPGGYDIWMSRRIQEGWGPAEPVSFNSPQRDFDPAFSSDGRFVYFCSDRPGGVGGDDIYRAAVNPNGFGPPESLGSQVNSAHNEFAPMLSPDNTQLLFSSDRPGGAGRHDLYTARLRDDRFAQAAPVPGDVNTAADEFDATFLADNATIVFARAPSMQTDRVDLFYTSPRKAGYPTGVLLPQRVNGDKDAYGPMLDWSQPDQLTFSAQRPGARTMDLYLIRYRAIQAFNDD